jgi:hypothetical protein
MITDIFSNRLWGYGGPESVPAILSVILVLAGIVSWFATVVHMLRHQTPVAVRVCQVTLLTIFLFGLAFVGSLV